jgi:hypothetical protein
MTRVESLEIQLENYKSVVVGDTMLIADLKQQLEAERVKVAEVLRNNIVAFTDCINDYAPEFCSPDRVKEARLRMSRNGKLSFFAEAIKQNDDALAAFQSPEDKS